MTKKKRLKAGQHVMSERTVPTRPGIGPNYLKMTEKRDRVRRQVRPVPPRAWAGKTRAKETRAVA